MKRLALLFALAALGGGVTLGAEDMHHGPVVYPTTPAPSSQPASTDTATPPATLAPDTNSDLTTPPPGTANNSAPSANVPATPAPDDSSAATAAPSAPTPPAAAPANNPLSALSSAMPGANGKPDDIYDIRPPFFYLKSWFWIWIVLAALALIALIVVLWIWLKPFGRMHAKTAYELALEKLEKARAMLNEQNPEPYAVYVSETIRTYLGQRFRTPSTRRTTEEFLRQMQADSSTPLAAHRDLLRGFLESCDLVKFAHYQPGREELEQVQQRAVTFVTATRPVEGAPA